MKKILFIVLLLAFITSTESIGQTVYKTKTGSKYHTSNHYANSTSISLSEAVNEGLGACAVCKPPTQLTESSEANKFASPNDYPARQSTHKTKPSSSTSSKQCNGTTKAGQRCKRTTTDPSGYCYQHK